jgi:hypothetical protein
MEVRNGAAVRRGSAWIATQQRQIVREVIRMSTTKLSLVVAALIAASIVHAQNGPTFIGTGYGVPQTMIAPGQIVRFRLTGLKSIFIPPVKAASAPLPTNLGGISVTLKQTVRHYLADTPSPLEPLLVPLVSIGQLDLCSSGASPDCMVTDIMAQIPYEMEVNPTSACPCYDTAIVISENGVDSKSFRVLGVIDQVHVVTDCDVNLSPYGCKSTVTHPDGALVSAGRPARPGEIVIIWAWGFGRTFPSVRSGELAPTPAPVAGLLGGNGVQVLFVFSPNAAASRVPLESSLSATVYLTPGQIGLYQVNVQLPSTFPDVVPCGTFVDSNLTINLTAPWSTDGAAICVQAGQ